MDSKKIRVNEPTILVLFGATGDLAQRKIFPSLLDLYNKDLLPKKFKIVAFGRRDWSETQYREFVSSALNQSKVVDESRKIAFLDLITYEKGLFDDDAAFSALGKRLSFIDTDFNICTNKLFYLAVPPNLYELILSKLSKSGLSIPCGGEKGWTRILIEKPFGKNLEDAERIDRLLGKQFKEIQIFRIDHYLAKETLLNILAFRFSNSIFEPLWNRKYIESISIKMFESSLVGSRGAFYDGIGALRDIGQNHLLAMLSLVTMEHPKVFNSDNIRKERQRVLKRLVIPGRNEIRKIIRGQYEGFKESQGVSADSDTETFFRLTTSIKGSRWSGVPIELTAGKGVGTTKTEITIEFKDVKTFFHDIKTNKNKLIFRVQPDEGISVMFWVKTPGFESFKVHSEKLSFNYSDSDITKIVPEAYERVLFDCIRGDQTLFATTGEVEAQWRFINPILKNWKTSEMKIYRSGTNPEEII
jgi:glucose-6-phosphate 1-dehydrogenase